MHRRWIIILAAAVTLGGVVACATPPQPYDYHDVLDEKPGPGLFSGDEGGFVITGESAKAPAETEDAPADWEGIKE